MTGDRRYSEEEFAIIIRQASELHEGRAAGGTEGTTSGLSLAEIQAIAREVGLDADKVARAAAALPTGGGREGKGLLGGPVKYLYEAEVPGELAEGDMGRVLDTLRREVKHQGEAVDVLGALEWKSVGWTNQVHVTIAPRDGKTAVRILADRSATAVLATLFPILGWLIAAGLTAGSLEAVGLPAATIMGVGVLGAAGTVRLLWRHTGRSLGRTLRGLMSGLTSEIGSLTRPVELPPADPES